VQVVDGAARASGMAGHRTPSVFRRYDIVSETDLTEAAAKLDAVNPDSSVTASAKPAERESRLELIS